MNMVKETSQGPVQVLQRMSPLQRKQGGGGELWSRKQSRRT